MTEQLDRRPSKMGRALRLGVAGILLAVPLTASRANAAETTEPIQPIYVYLPQWDCNQQNLLRQKSDDSINYTRPETSVTIDLISITYPIDLEGNKTYQTVIYENPGLPNRQTLRYFSDSSDCSGGAGTQVIR